MSVVDPGIQQNIPGSGNIFTATGDVFVFEKPEVVTNRQLLSNLRILLNKVRTFWIQGVLEKSIHHAVLINLDKEVRPEAVEHPWEMVLELPDNERHLLPAKTDVIDIFNRSTRALLILGEPGSGKTTTLLDLANKLIEKAQQDISTEPIPVIFNLSSWRTSKTLADWLIKELTEKYQIPKKIGETWLEENRLLPLLDGFDEITETYRQSCIASINEFIGTYGLPGLVVCSRISEYTRLPVRLKLNAAICVQPLTGQQINSYLKTAIGKDNSLQRLLKNNDLLYHLAQTPLFLSILCLAHRTSPEEVKNLSAVSAEEYIRKIFDIYVERVLRRKGEKNLYPPDQVQKKLSWLAKRMVERSQTVFQVEGLQPDWLPSAKERLIYFMLSRTALWFLIGFLGLIGFAVFTPEAGLGRAAIVGVVLGVLGTFVGLADWQRFEQSTVHPTTSTKRDKITRRLKDAGYFLWLQLTVLSLWLGLMSAFGMYEAQTGSLLSYQSLGELFRTLPVYPPSKLFVAVLSVLELGLFFLMWKFMGFLRLVGKTALAIVWFRLVFSFLVSVNMNLGYALIGLYIVVLLVLWRLEKLLLRVPAVLWLGVLLLVALVKIGLSGPGKFNLSYEFLLWPGISIVTGLAILVATIRGGRGRYKDPPNEVRTTESVSWSWKRALPLTILSILSLLLFIGTLFFRNNVTLWDSQTPRKIAILRETVFTRWRAAYSPEGRRIVLLGGKSGTARGYLYDSSQGQMIAELETYRLSAQATFNVSGSRLLVEGSGSCPEWCYAELWDAETGKHLRTLNVHLALEGQDLEGLDPSPGPSFFTDDGNLIFHSLRLYQLKVPQQGGSTRDILYRLGYVVYGAKTGEPLVVFFPTPAQDSPQLYIGYLSPTYEKHILVDMSQIGRLLIYDDGLLKELPLTIRNLESNGGTCFWSVSSEGVDCSPNPLPSDLGLLDHYLIQMAKATQPYFTFDFYQPENREPDVTLDANQASLYGILAFGTVNFANKGAIFPVKLYPFSTVIPVENPRLPQLMTITDGVNPLGYAFGFLSLLAVAALIMQGLSTSVIEGKGLPNQGVLLSLRNSLILGVIITLVFGLVFSIVYVLFFGESEIRILGLGIGALVGTLAWALYGGMDVVFHYTLRLVLAVRGYLPWKLIPFLNYCADNLLLQKVGGGYIFIHRMLLENFARKVER